MREKALELKKEITVMQDFMDAEEIQEEISELENAKRNFDEIFNNLSNEDKKWLNEQFFQWIEIYMSRCSSGCSACAGSCPSV